MVAGKNYNVVTKQAKLQSVAGSNVTAIGAVVPTGMKRYVTFIHVSRVQGATNIGSKVYIASAAGATLSLASASASAKMIVILASAVYKASTNTGAGGPGNFSIPGRINTDKPLFSVAAGKYLLARQASTAALGNAETSLFVQYYDQ